MYGEWTEADQQCIDAYEVDLKRLDRREYWRQVGQTILESLAYASPITIAQHQINSDDETKWRDSHSL